VLARQIQAALGLLSPKLRVRWCCATSKGCRTTRIAEVLGCSMGTVASRLSRAHKALAVVLSRAAPALTEGLPR